MEKRKKKEYSDRWNHLLDFAEKGDLRRLQIIFEDPDNQTLLDNLLGTGNRTLLHQATKGKQPEVVQYLLEKGASPSLKTLTQQTPLHYAAIYNQSEIAKSLLSAGAFVDETDMIEQTPLHLAAINGKEEVVLILLDCGASKSALDKYGRTPAALARKKKFLPVAEQIEVHVCGLNIKRAKPVKR